MPKIRLLVSVAGEANSTVRRPVVGNPGDILEVDSATARVWCDGVRAERVIDRSVPVERADLGRR